MDIGTIIAGVFSTLWWFSFGWFLSYVVLGSWLEVQLVHLKIDKRLALNKRFGPIFVFHFLFSVSLVNPYSILWVGDKLDDIFSAMAGNPNPISALLYLLILPIILECLFLRIIAQWRWLRWFQWRPPLKRVILASLLINLVSFGAGYGAVFVRDVTLYGSYLQWYQTLTPKMTVDQDRGQTSEFFGYNDSSSLSKGRWVKKPNGFVQYVQKRPAHWKHSYINLEGTPYTAGVGPYHYTDETNKDCDYYCIDIEKPYTAGSTVIAELNIPLSFVSKECLSKEADRLVVFNKTEKTATFNLGRGIFIYKFE